VRKIKWRILVLLLILIAVSLTFYWHCKHSGITWYAWGYRENVNDACVRDELRGYFTQAKLNLQLNIQLQQTMSLGTESAHIHSLPKLIKEIDKLRRESACEGYLPFRIYAGDIQSYPTQLPSSCTSANPTKNPTPRPTPTPPQSVLDKKKEILTLAQSVGRLGIRRQGTPPDKGADFWATGFLIAPDVIATTCHVMDPVMVVKNGKHELHLDGEELVVDFAWTTGDKDYTYQCVINKVLGCSSRPGMDVALLGFDKGACQSPSRLGTLPSGLVLDTAEPQGIENDNFSLVGFADMNHPIDADTQDIYKPWKDTIKKADAQFVMGDQVPQVDKCGGTQVEILLDFAITTIGESGAVLTDLTKAESGKPLKVFGMHTCCSAFFKDEYGVPPKSSTACAQLRRTFDNQAISTWSIFKDPELCPVLKQHNVSGADCQ